MISFIKAIAWPICGGYFSYNRAISLYFHGQVPIFVVAFCFCLFPFFMHSPLAPIYWPSHPIFLVIVCFYLKCEVWFNVSLTFGSIVFLIIQKSRTPLYMSSLTRSLGEEWSNHLCWADVKSFKAPCGNLSLSLVESNSSKLSKTQPWVLRSSIFEKGFMVPVNGLGSSHLATTFSRKNIKS